MSATVIICRRPGQPCGGFDMLTSVGVRKRFSAAHRLEGHPGRCSRLHGHTWLVMAVFTGERVGPDGMLLDFDEAGEALQEVVDDFDHSYLNDMEPFDSIPPTAENVARVIFERLKEKAARRASFDNSKLTSVTVWESPDNSASVMTEPHLPPLE